MKVTQYPLATSSWGEAEIEAMQKVIASGNFTMGKEVLACEKAFAEFSGSRHALMVNSGSSANLLMIAALFYCRDRPLQRGDEVIVPAVSWSTTYSPLAQYGLKVKFVDIDLETLNFDLDALRSAIGPKTRLILAVNLLGNSNDYLAIQAMIADRPIRLLEDNCESLGATYGGRQLGTIGLMGTYSSFFSHHISTMEGGFVVTDDEELHHILLCLRAHGWTRNLPKFNHVTGEKDDDPFVESFKFVLPGYNFRPLELEAAIGIEQIKKLPSFIAARRANARVFQDLFAESPDFIIQKELGDSSWFGFSFVIRAESPLTRLQVVRCLQDAKIDCRPIVAGNFAKNQVLKWFDYEIHGELKNADWIDQNGLFVGNHQYDISQELNYLNDTLKSLG